MKVFFSVILLLFHVITFSQPDTANKRLRAFPITDYIVDLNDSTKLVQLEMPEGLLIKEKEMAVLWGVYGTSASDAVEKGFGRCNLIKKNYFYFTISNNKSGKPIQKGDLLYTHVPNTKIYEGQVPKIASHFIRLLSVYDEPLFDRYNVFIKWSTTDEKNFIDSAISDIKFTGNYFLENDPSMNRPVESGDYAGKKTLDVMIKCTAGDLVNFFDYMIARPRNYAGREWKVSEVFATWVVEGAPTVKK